jgi:hypothetical protein
MKSLWSHRHEAGPQHRQCSPKGFNKGINGMIMEWVQASRTFDSNGHDGIKNLDYGYVDDTNKWRAHVNTHLSDEITRVMAMGDNQRKLSELHVPARGLRGRAIPRVDAFIPNFSAAVTDASRAQQ